MTSTGTCLAPMNTYTAFVVSEDGLRRPGGVLYCWISAVGDCWIVESCSLCHSVHKGLNNSKCLQSPAGLS